MSNIYWNIKQNSKKSSYHARTLFLQSWVYNERYFYKFHCKNQKQPPEEFGKNVFLEILQSSQEKTCACQSLFFHKVAGLLRNF